MKIVEVVPVTGSRRGRPRAGEREQRVDAVLDAALAELVAQGVDGITMTGIARRARASKETLYAWFGGREGLIGAVIERNADRSATAVADALEGGGDHRATLVGYGTGLLTLLTSDESVALNRAAMTDPSLAERLLASGRHRIGPLVERYLSSLHDAGTINAPRPDESFALLYGLVVQDVQIRVLLGERPPSAVAIRSRAGDAVDRFLDLTVP